MSPRSRLMAVPRPAGESSGAGPVFAIVNEPEYGFLPRALRREAAAYYVGVSPAKFDDWVANGVMPGPKKQDGVVSWDRRKLDAAYDALPDRDGAPENPYRD